MNLSAERDPAFPEFHGEVLDVCVLPVEGPGEAEGVGSQTSPTDLHNAAGAGLEPQRVLLPRPTDG